MALAPRNDCVNPSAIVNISPRWDANSGTRVTGLVGPPRDTGVQVSLGTAAYSSYTAGGGAVTSLPGVQWSGVGWVRSSVARTFRFYMGVYQNENFVNSVSTGQKDIALAANTWTQVNLVQTTPSGTYNNIRFLWDIPSSGSAGTAITSSICWAPNINDPSMTYVDGDTPGYAWTGTVGASNTSYVGLPSPEPGRFLIAV